MELHSIYKISNNVNQKVYIGYTSNFPEKRWKQHLANSGYVRKRKLYQAIKKYGKKNFIFDVLYQSHDKEHTMKMETHFILEHDSYKNGYNGSLGGDGPNTEEMKAASKERMLKNNPMKILRTNRGSFVKGRKPDPETFITREKKRLSKLGKNNPNFGKPETANRMNILKVCFKCGYAASAGNIMRWHNENCRNVI